MEEYNKWIKRTLLRINLVPIKLPSYQEWLKGSKDIKVLKLSNEKKL